MRGQADRQPKLFFSIDIEDRIRPDHPLRPLGRTVDGILRRLSNRFAAAYSRVGRPSVPPERLLGALLLMAIYSVRSERQLVERPLFKRTGTDLLFRWFLDMDPAEDAFDATVFTHNRRRLDEYGLTAAFFEAVVELAIDAGLVSDEHFTVDGTLIESCASIKSLRPVEDAAGTDTPPEGSGTDGSGTRRQRHRRQRHRRQRHRRQRHRRQQHRLQRHRLQRHRLQQLQVTQSRC